MIDGLGGADRVNNFLSTLNLKPIQKENLKEMEKRAGAAIEAVAQDSMNAACITAYSAEMK